MIAPYAVHATAPTPPPSPYRVESGPVLPPIPAFPLPSGHYYGYGDYMSGYGLKQWQNYANVHWGTRLVVDGKFGPATYSAARSIQYRAGIGVDGKIGATTWAKTFSKR